MPPSPDVVLDLIEAFRRSKTMFTAVSLGVFDRLEEGPATAEELAREMGAPSIDRLLDGCAALGLLIKTGGRYSNTEAASTYLCRESPHTMTGYILYSDQALYPMWGHLEEAIREGTHRWAQTFGIERDIFAHFFRTREALHDFILGMHGLGMLGSPAVAAAFDLSGFQRMVDLGGATGHLPMAIRERYPEMEAAVFDLPQVIEMAREFAEGIDLIAGDFFRDPLPPADLYAVSRILHDWSEEKIVTLLRKVYDALPEGGGLLIAERLLDEDKMGPVAANMQSLNMLICTEGRERTVSEYEGLVKAAGFRSLEAKVTGAPLDAMLTRKDLARS